MAHVHLFGDVWRGVVNHDSLCLRLCDTQTIAFQRLSHVLGKKSRIEENIDKAWPGDFHFIGDAIKLEMRQYLLCQLSRRHAQFLGNRHHAVSLIVAELYFC